MTFEGSNTNQRGDENTFADYLIHNKHPNRRHIKTAKIHRLSLQWRNQINKVDCGVFLMRHMETYRGGLLDWDCGFCKEEEVNNSQKNQLNNLRRKYITKIILHGLNERVKWVINDVRQYLQLPLEVRRDVECTCQH
ncbi:hypothetical protein R6Q57_006355 [Mikania cordata]